MFSHVVLHAADLAAERDALLDEAQQQKQAKFAKRNRTSFVVPAD